MNDMGRNRLIGTLKDHFVEAKVDTIQLTLVNVFSLGQAVLIYFVLQGTESSEFVRLFVLAMSTQVVLILGFVNSWEYARPYLEARITSNERLRARTRQIQFLTIVAVTLVQSVLVFVVFPDGLNMAKFGLTLYALFSSSLLVVRSNLIAKQDFRNLLLVISLQTLVLTPLAISIFSERVNAENVTVPTMVCGALLAVTVGAHRVRKMGIRPSDGTVTFGRVIDSVDDTLGFGKILLPLAILSVLQASLPQTAIWVLEVHSGDSTLMLNVALGIAVANVVSGLILAGTIGSIVKIFTNPEEDSNYRQVEHLFVVLLSICFLLSGIAVATTLTLFTETNGFSILVISIGSSGLTISSAVISLTKIRSLLTKWDPIDYVAGVFSIGLIVLFAAILSTPLAIFAGGVSASSVLCLNELRAKRVKSHRLARNDSRGALSF